MMEGPTGGKIPHSHSSPATMDTGPQDATLVAAAENEAKKCGKLLSIDVIMLDDSTATFEIQHKALGQVLFDQVCKQLHLLEVDYFGLEYIDSTGAKYWLDHEKPMNRQLGFSLFSPVLKFCVKFYTPAPAQLEEEYTRYLFCLQIKRDLADGVLQCNDNTSALMASYIVQADCGDYAPEDYPDHTYLSSYKFVPHQDSDMERRIMENHKRHTGQSPAEADLNLLETARRCELYGIKMHSAKDHEGVPLNLATAHMGVLVFQNFTKINTFSWAKIRKLSFKRKRFLLKLHPEGYGYYKDTVEFFFEGRNECKNFWKKCVEHHGFFRCAAVKKMPRQKTRVISRGSSFRYSGRTQKQIVDYVRDNYVKRQPFQRSQSFRQTSTSHSGLSGVSGGKFPSSPHSVQPPIPIGTPTSRSCGSVTLSEGSTPSPTHADANQLQTALDAPVTNGHGHQDEPDASSTTFANGELDAANKQEDWPVTSAGFFSTHATSYSCLQHSNDNDDSISYESYQLDEQILLASPDKQCPLAEPEGESVCEDEYESEDETVHETFNTNDERGGESISYKLHRRQLEVVKVKPAPLTLDLTTPNPKPKPQPVKPPRVMVEFEVDHAKNPQTSPTLYVRSRLGVGGPSSDDDDAPRHKVLNFVAVHDLPPIRSYSSQDDSAPDEQEDIKRLSWKKRRKEQVEVVAEPPTTDSSLNLNFIDDSSEEVEALDVKMSDDEDVSTDDDLRVVENEELKIVEDADLEMQNLSDGDEKMEVDAERLFIKDESECMLVKDDEFTFKDADNLMENGVDDDCSNGGTQDLDEDDLDPLFPMRTLSRISEHSTSDSTPSETAVNKSSMAGSSSSSEEMVTEGNWDNLTHLEAEMYDSRLDLPDAEDEDSRKVVETTYYLEINSDQREQLEKLEKAGAPIFRGEMDSTETEEEETSSVENDTLCEEPSLHEGLDDIEEIASDAEQYEGINVRIRIGPEKSPKSLIRYEGQEDLSSDLNISKKRHRSELQLQVSRGEIREDTDTSRSGDEDDFVPSMPAL